MTKEELEKEARTECFMLTVNTIGIDQRDVELAYVMGAEPREKEIKSLGERCLQLQKDKGNLTDRVKELEAQIDKIKCCYNCSKWNDGECEESPKSKTFFCADFKCDNWEMF